MPAINRRPLVYAALLLLPMTSASAAKHVPNVKDAPHRFNSRRCSRLRPGPIWIGNH
jgi:hypothetical protein